MTVSGRRIPGTRVRPTPRVSPGSKAEAQRAMRLAGMSKATDQQQPWRLKCLTSQGYIPGNTRVLLERNNMQCGEALTFDDFLPNARRGHPLNISAAGNTRLKSKEGTRAVETDSPDI